MVDLLSRNSDLGEIRLLQTKVTDLFQKSDYEFLQMVR